MLAVSLHMDMHANVLQLAVNQWLDVGARTLGPSSYCFRWLWTHFTPVITIKHVEFDNVCCQGFCERIWCPVRPPLHRFCFHVEYASTCMTIIFHTFVWLPFNELVLIQYCFGKGEHRGLVALWLRMSEAGACMLTYADVQAEALKQKHGRMLKYANVQAEALK